MVYLVFTLCKAGELALNTCTDTLAAGKAYLQLLGHGRLVGCEKSFACFQDALLLLVEGCVMQVLNPDSSITGSEKVVKPSTVFVKKMAAL